MIDGLTASAKRASQRLSRAYLGLRHCVLWDGSTARHIVAKTDNKKDNAFFVDLLLSMAHLRLSRVGKEMHMTTKTKPEKPIAQRIAEGAAITVIATILGGLLAGPAGAAVGAKIGACCGGGSGCC